MGPTFKLAVRPQIMPCTRVAHVRLASGFIPRPTSGVRMSMCKDEGFIINASKSIVCVLVES